MAEADMISELERTDQAVPTYAEQVHALREAHGDFQEAQAEAEPDDRSYREQVEALRAARAEQEMLEEYQAEELDRDEPKRDER